MLKIVFILYGHQSLRKQMTMNMNKIKQSRSRRTAGHFIAASLNCDSGQAFVVDSLNASSGKFETPYFYKDAGERMLSVLLEAASHFNDQWKPALIVKQQKLTRTQGLNDCGPCSMLYLSTMLSDDETLAERLTYTNDQICLLRRVHDRMLKVGWYDHLTFRYVCMC